MIDDNEFQKEIEQLYDLLAKEIMPALDGKETKLSKFLYDLEDKDSRLFLSVYSFNFKYHDFKIHIDSRNISNMFVFLKNPSIISKEKDEMENKAKNITGVILIETAELISKFLEYYAKTKEWHYCQYDEKTGFYYVVDLRNKCLMTINSEDCMYKLASPIGFEYTKV